MSEELEELIELDAVPVRCRSGIGGAFGGGIGGGEPRLIEADLLRKMLKFIRCDFIDRPETDEVEFVMVESFVGTVSSSGDRVKWSKREGSSVPSWSSSLSWY